MLFIMTIYLCKYEHVLIVFVKSVLYTAVIVSLSSGVSSRRTTKHFISVHWDRRFLFSFFFLNDYITWNLQPDTKVLWYVEVQIIDTLFSSNLSRNIIFEVVIYDIYKFMIPTSIIKGLNILWELLHFHRL